MRIEKLFEKFIETKSMYLKPNTISLYQREYKLHFGFFIGRNIEDLKSNDIDDWIRLLRRKNKNKQRCSFEHELTLLQNIISFYNEYSDNPVKINLIKKRHHQLALLKEGTERNLEMTEKEFICFKESLALLYGRTYELMALIQYYQALRISEVVALKYEDIYLNKEHPELSYIRINKSVAYNHGHGLADKIQAGYKNGKLKILPLMPEVYQYLSKVPRKGKFLFLKNGIIPYNRIRKYYNRAFKEANLPYQGTHVLRHGGCRLIYNLSSGNIIIASQLLGDTEYETFKTYAKGYKKELQEFIKNKFFYGLNEEKMI